MVRFFLFFVILFANSCGIRERELQLERLEKALAQKEQELTLKEKTLEIKEAELNQQQLSLDSTVADTTTVINPMLPGIWDVQMTCTEASCPGSAVGDVRSETWNFQYVNGNLVVKAMSGNTLVRVYTGKQKNNMIELQDNVDNAADNPPTRLTVRLNITGNNILEGTRVIDRNGECRIVYSLTLNKK